SACALATQGSPSNSNASLLRGVKRCSSAPGRCRMTTRRAPTSEFTPSAVPDTVSTVSRQAVLLLAYAAPQLWFRYGLPRADSRRDGRPQWCGRLGPALLRTARTDRQPWPLRQSAPLPARVVAARRVHPDVAAARHTTRPDPRGPRH